MRAMTMRNMLAYHAPVDKGRSEQTNRRSFDSAEERFAQDDIKVEDVLNLRARCPKENGGGMIPSPLLISAYAASMEAAHAARIVHGTKY